MKAPKEFRQFVNKARSKWGKKNGNLPRHFFDHPAWELYWDNNRKEYDRNKEKNVRD